MIAVIRHELAPAALVAGSLSGIPSTVHALATRRPVGSTVAAAGELLGRAGVARGIVAHAAMTAGWTSVLLVILRSQPRRAMVCGAIGGLGIAGLDFTIADRRFPAIASLPRWPQVLDHVLFGVLVGAVVARRRSSGGLDTASLDEHR